MNLYTHPDLHYHRRIERNNVCLYVCVLCVYVSVRLSSCQSQTCKYKHVLKHEYVYINRLMLSTDESKLQPVSGSVRLSALLSQLRVIDPV